MITTFVSLCTPSLGRSGMVSTTSAGATFAEVFEETDFLATPIGAGTVIVSCTTNPS